MKTKILVTGGAGFIGSNFTRYILRKYQNYHVVVLDLLTYAGNLDNLTAVKNNKNFSFVRGDIRDRKTIEEVIKKVDVVVHFAAETHVDRSILFADDFITTDVYGTFILLEAARKYKIKKFLHISTDEVYGEVEDKPSKEDSTLLPKSPYAASKAGADRLVFSYFITHNLPVIITRCVNNYGCNQYPEKMIPLFITNALENKNLPVYGDGKNTREWLNVEDHCAALDILMHQDMAVGEVFNIGSGEELSVLQIANKILEMLEKPRTLIQLIKDRPGHVKRHAVNSNKIKNAVRWKSKIKFSEGIADTVKWYNENPNWWRKIKARQKGFTSFYKVWYEKR